MSERCALCLVLLVPASFCLVAIFPVRFFPVSSFDLMSEPPQCCICLDEFSRPASLPCGHSFCLGCIGEYWRIQPVCQCPLCKAFFPARPQLRTDARQTEVVPIRAGEVACDSCPGKAVKSCLVCLASYCASHLEPHYQQEDLGRHLLVSVEKNLEDSVCKLHGRQLEKFCRSDQTCICIMCVQTEHRGHRVVSVGKEAARKKVKKNNENTKRATTSLLTLCLSVGETKTEKHEASSDDSGATEQSREDQTAW